MDKLRRIIVPGIIFQAVIIGGGYISGREAMEYCIKFGNNGIFVLLLCSVLFAAFLYLSFLTVYKFKTYDYRTFSIKLLGKYWILFDVLFLFMAVVAIAVVLSTTAKTAESQFNFNYLITTIILVFFLAIISFLGYKWIVRFKGLGTFLLYAAYIYFFIRIVWLPNTSRQPVSELSINVNWMLSSLQYVCYNLVAVPSCFLAIKELKSKKEVMQASIIGGILSMLPMLLIFIMLLPEKDLVNASIPLLELFKSKIGISALYIYYFILVIVLVDTGVGLIHAISDRIENHISTFSIISFKKIYRSVIAIILSVLSIMLAQFGVIDLVGEWYGNAAWGFFVLMVIPLLLITPSLFKGTT